MPDVGAYLHSKIDYFRCSIRMMRSYFLDPQNCGCLCGGDDFVDYALKIPRRMVIDDFHYLIERFQIDASMDWQSTKSKDCEYHYNDDNDIQDSNPFLKESPFDSLCRFCSISLIYLRSFRLSSVLFRRRSESKFTKGAPSTKSIFCEYRISKLTLF
jgi:hypothetical protein